MKKYLVFAAAASLFAACSNDDGAVAGPQQEAQQTAGEVAVGFDAYVNRATTRAGLTGDITAEAIKTAKVGFGVFAYHTNADLYDQTFVPNFMYNQQVTYTPGTGSDPGTWGYTPIKYWPNEFGQDALSEDVDKVSFFAYAPYVTVDAASGKVKSPASTTYDGDNGDKTYGIVGMKSNSATGDPMVKYMASFYTNKQVDLTWGTAGTANVTWDQKKMTTGSTPTNATQTIAKGLPWLNIEHPKATSISTQKVKFQFEHALARLNVTVDTKANSTSSAASPLNEIGTSASATKVFIRSVTFEGFDMKGALNLNNAEENKALWFNFDCLSELNNGSEVTIKDGRTDGKEGVTAATKELAAINPTFVQSDVWASATAGVTGTAANLFGLWNSTDNKIDVITGEGAAEKPIYVIPNGDPLKVTIEYDVLTKDDNLVGKLNDGQTKGSVVKNVITRYITIGSSASGSAAAPTGYNDADGKGIKLVNGKKYTISLHLGLNSVEFDADVTGWDTTNATGGADLPHNN